MKQLICCSGVLSLPPHPENVVNYKIGQFKLYDVLDTRRYGELFLFIGRRKVDGAAGDGRAWAALVCAQLLASVCLPLAREQMPSSF